MAIFVQDNFNRTAGALIGTTPSGAGSNWTTSATFPSSNLQITAAGNIRATSAYNNVAYSSSPAGTDYYAAADFVFSGGTSAYVCLCVGITTNNFYYIGVNASSTLGVYAFDNGNVSSAISSTVTMSAGETYRCTLSRLAGAGNVRLVAICVRQSDGFYLNSSGTFQSSATNWLDTTDTRLLTTGVPGIQIYGSQASTGEVYIDNFEAGDGQYGTSSPATGYSLTGPSTCTVGTASSNFTVTLTPSGGTNSGVTITLSDSSGGGSFTPSTVSLSTGTPSATFTYTAGSSGTKTISTTNSGSLTNPTSLSVTASAASLTMGALSVSARTTSSITVSWSAATGGTGTKTYVLYRHTSAPFTPPGTGTSVGSTTSTSLTDSSPGTGNVFYRVVVTDGASSTSTSVQSASQGALLTRVVLAPIVVGLIGDSITNFMGTASAFISLLQAQEPTRTVSLGSNQGVSGTTSTDWLPGGSYLPGALSAFATAGVTHVSIMLGTNDSKPSVATSTGTYSSNIASIAAACVTAGYKVCLNAPLYLTPGGSWDEASNTKIIAYRDSLAALTNGTTIFMGDTQLFDAVAASPATYLSDGVHPNGTGNTLIWNRWAAN